MASEQPGQVINPDAVHPQSSWQFHAEESSDPGASPQVPSSDVETVSWSASEFIAHDKSAGWYSLLVLGTIVLAALVYLLSHGDKVSTGVVIIVLAVFGIMAARKPRELNYSVDDKGLHIGDKFYNYSTFRSFSIVQQDSVESIWLMPLKRFLPIITIYFDSHDGQKITDTLSQFLPVENRQPDLVDKLMHRLRF